MDRTQIADYLAKKVFDRDLRAPGIYIMLKNKQIYFEGDYVRLIKSNQISPEDAFVFIDFHDCNEYKSYDRSIEYLFPLIDDFSIYDIMDSYLDKLGFYSPNYVIYPATGLKYYAVTRLFSDRLVIEIVDIDIVITNIGLMKIVADVLGKDMLTLMKSQKELSFEQINKLVTKLTKHKLFVGYKLDKVREIIIDYYIRHDTSLAKDALAIAKDYNRIFQPYRVVYDTSTRQQVLM